MQSKAGKVTRLTLHVGLPKTATTTLQTHVFPQVPGFIGRSRANLGPATEAPYRKFRAVVNKWERGRSAWSADIASFVASLGNLSEDEALVSEESLSGWVIDGDRAAWPVEDGWFRLPRVRPHPLADRTAELRAAADGLFDVRIILTLRNQPDLMGSLYAQLQGGMGNPSQDDFEAKVARTLSNDEPVFDYASLVEELLWTVGGDDVLVLLHEDGMERNVSRIAEFLGTPLRATEDLRENVKREGPQAWRGAWVDRPVTRRGTLGRARTTADRLWPEALRALAPPLKRMLAGLDAASARVVEPKHHVGVRVEFTHELAERVRDHYRPSNERLGQLIGRDLESLGY